ncbi:cadherin-7-like [Gadus chalcogrammus]|uniref:cadherin-7-like n=1 Tax=Gadus chalcogrammus TaxID=1042646 RepID=UPI0024C493FB|nr:cadherin-7-like [Gadus chalcogrammus]
MSCCVVLRGFCVGLVLLSLWSPCYGELTLNSVPLAPARGPSRGGPPRQGGHGWGPARSRRSWVWNQFFVLEEYTGDEPLYVGKLHSDMDRGDGQVTYVLSGEGAPSIFTIDPNTGDIHATKRLDREAQAYYTLRAQARDRASARPVEPESQFVVKVQDINDNEPRFLDGPYAASVPEMSPMGTSVVTVVATDADDPTYGNSARVVYSILQGQPYFSVEPKTGLIRTALADMDRESRDQYLLVIQAKDMVGQMGGLSGTTSVTVTLSDVNDNPPHFYRKSYQYLVPESAPLASLVAKVKAVDSDLGSNADVDYSILDGDPLGMFRIVTDRETQEGLLTLQKVLDYEARPSYTLTVEVTNRYVDPRFVALGPFSDRATVRLLVKNVDEPPVFSSDLAKMAVSEAVDVGTSVGRVSALDPDSTNSPVRYSIDRNTDLERYFHIDGSTGVLRTARLLDRELVSLHNITVTASESLDPSQVGTSVVLISVTDVNDNAPAFAIDYQPFVCENARSGQVIETISAVDRDEPQTGHRFLFSLLSPGDGATANFTLRDNQDNTASVLTRRAGFLRREQPLHLLPVLISDAGPPALSSTGTLWVRVCACDADGGRSLCGEESSLLRAAGLSPAALLSILACLLLLLGLVLLVATARRRRRNPFTLDDDRDVRENIVRYDDEGGGEEDTEAFDMAALRHLNATRDGEGAGTRRYDNAPELLTARYREPQHNATVAMAPPSPTQVQPPPPPPAPDNTVFREFILSRLLEADLDSAAPPYDSLQTYAFEGSGSAAESLSSLESPSSESEHAYDFLTEWGADFGKLADLYGHSDGRSSKTDFRSPRLVVGEPGGAEPTVPLRR